MSTSDEDAQLAATSAFIAHFTSPEVGGYLHPSLQPKIDGITGLSIFTSPSSPSSSSSSSAIAKDERLVTCPHGEVITPLIARQAIEAICPDHSAGELDGWKETMLICGYIALHWLHPQRTELRHSAYIASLPPASTLRTPLHFTEPEMGLLEGTNLHGATLDRRRQWEEEWGTVNGVLGDQLIWDQYLTAATYISSRAFPSKLLSTPKDGVKTTETSAVQTSAEEESHPVLIPGMDMFNHARGQPITWLSSNEASGTISLVTPSGLSADSQVFNNYGPKPNEELLLGYGFVLDPNPDDVVPLRLGGNMSRDGSLSDAKKRRLAAKGLEVGTRWLIKRNGEIPRDLMEVLRILLGDDSSHHDHGDDEEDEEHEHGHWEEEMELEQDVLGALGQMLEDKLVRLEQTAAAAAAQEADGVREDVKAMCEVYRRGQVEILEKTMETVEERIDRVERLTAEGEGCPCCN